MKILTIIAHQPYSFSPGKLNATFTEMAEQLLKEKGHEVKVTYTSAESTPYDVGVKVDEHALADVVIVQTPVN